jgi:hypothetical protein
MDKTISIERSVLLNPETGSYDLVLTSLYLTNTGTILAKITGEKLEVLQEYESIKEHMKKLMKTLEEYQNYSYRENISTQLRNEKLKELGI